jgi:dihydrolipoamide dehydrogenase
VSEVKKNIIVIGSGVCGYVAAIRAAQLGAKATVIERADTLGGTCLNRGCIPTKALLKSAEVLSLAKGAATFGVHIDKAWIDLPLAMKWKGATVSRLVNGVNSLMRKNKIAVVKGTATIIDPQTVMILESKEKIKGNNILIATGSKPLKIPIKGIDEPGIMTSDDALALERLPQSMLIIGGGVVGLEFAQIFARMGAKVSVVEMMPQILPAEDAEVAGALERALKKEGIEIITEAKVTAIATKGEEKKVSFTTKDGTAYERVVGGVLVAVGRGPNTDDLGAEKLGISLDKGRIVVNEKMETNIPGIYAAGDVVGRMMLAHVAMEEGKCAVENIMGVSSRVNYQVVPRCTYTSPEVAAVGLTEAEAKKKYPDVKVGRFPFVGSGRALTINQTEGMVKFVVDAKYGEILGVHILGPEASELIAEAVLAMQMETTYKDIGSCIHAHPTLSEAMMEGALAVDGKTINI